jgi:hypothetical protein
MCVCVSAGVCVCVCVCVCVQSRLANKGACTALIKRIIRHVAQKDEASVDCVERLGWALSSILLMGACHDRLECKSALGLCVRVCMCAQVCVCACV